MYARSCSPAVASETNRRITPNPHAQRCVFLQIIVTPFGISKRLDGGSGGPLYSVLRIISPFILHAVGRGAMDFGNFWRLVAKKRKEIVK
jgi:hypothetical protein